MAMPLADSCCLTPLYPLSVKDSLAQNVNSHLVLAGAAVQE